MPISIVVGGQFGSEGKGKVALEIVRRSKGPVSVVRVGGPNSGHTAYDRDGRRWALRQLPAACIDGDVDVIFPAGSYLDIELLLKEAHEVGFPIERILISEFANIITSAQKAWEQQAALINTIGSTGSGVGAAVMALVAREARNFPLDVLHAKDVHDLQMVGDTTLALHAKLMRGERIVIEGSQGFGLSLLDGGFWPKATARSTTAAAALSEAGLSPRFVDNITLVLRTYPIRVAGDSGPLVNETTWEEIASRCGQSKDLREFTTVTNKLRRVGEFDPSLVLRAIAANSPHEIVLNHLDYVMESRDSVLDRGKLGAYLARIEAQIGQKIDWLGFSAKTVAHAEEALA